MSEFILEFEASGGFRHPDRKWRMGLSKSDHEWLTAMFGVRAKSEESWLKGLGAWRYLGANIVAGPFTGLRKYRVRIRFRTKDQAVLFKLARLGNI